jgi:hypothetical protein
MQMLYNSEAFAVVQLEAPSGVPEAPALTRGGFEIVDKATRREIFIEGALAESFQQGVQALVQKGEASEEALDAFIARYSGLAQQPLMLH